MGPLSGIKVIEIKGIGPGPYAGMLLADMGAEVIVVERSSTSSGIALPSDKDCNSRGKKSIALNLKTESGLETLLTLVEQCDVLFEGFRPGVSERLGYGPDVCLQRNPKLIYGRITGWGQTGPLAMSAGHDINYISLTGALAATGEKDKPIVPLNIVGDYAGGSHFLVMGILAALVEVKTSGKGQVIDAAITDGSASVMSLFHSMEAIGQWENGRERNMLDGGAHYYDTYETADGKHVSIGPIEPKFHAELISLLELDASEFSEQYNKDLWPEYKAKLKAVFLTKTQNQWCELLEGTDTCFAPVLSFLEAKNHPHNIARETYIDINGLTQPAPAPRFSRTVSKVQSPPSKEGQDTLSVLKDFGFDDKAIATLQSDGALS